MDAISAGHKDSGMCQAGQGNQGIVSFSSPLALESPSGFGELTRPGKAGNQPDGAGLREVESTNFCSFTWVKQ